MSLYEVVVPSALDRRRYYDVDADPGWKTYLVFFFLGFWNRC
jgi:hypothetical protein